MGDIKIIDRKKLYKGFFDIEEVKAELPGSDEPISRILVIPKKAAAILLYKTDDKKIIFSRQQRVASMLDGGDGWITEIPAGVIDGSESTETCAKRESLEETGYKIKSCTFISSIYISPGYTTEKIDIYFSAVNSSDKVAEGGGMKDEHEVIRILEIDLAEAMTMMEDGRINDAKTIVALSWLNRRILEGKIS